MDYKVEWRDKHAAMAPPGSSLNIDPDTYSLGGDTRRYIDICRQDGGGFLWCVRVLFPKKTTDEKQDEVMQTVLMMAKARYGL